jgi:hypothetical protein
MNLLIILKSHHELSHLRSNAIFKLKHDLSLHHEANMDPKKPPTNPPRALNTVLLIFGISSRARNCSQCDSDSYE